MLKKALLLILACLAGILLTAPAEADQKAAASMMEEDMLTLINVTRNEPYLVAEALGMNPGQVFSGIPEHSPLWDRHKPVLQPIESLNQASGRHAQDMLARNYYSHISPEGKGPEQRAAEAGYRAEEIHEDMAMIVFQNFVPADKAGLEIYKQFFLDQVQLFKDGRSNIFSYNMRDLGLAFQAGKMNIDGRNRNVYLFVVQYGISSDRLVEESLARMINMSRSDYSQALDHFGIEEAEVSEALYGFSFIYLYGKLPPYVFLDSLYISDSGTGETGDDQSFQARINHELVWSVEVPIEADEWETAELLFEEMVFMDGFAGIRALLDAQSNVAAISVSYSLVDGSTMLIEAGLIIAAMDEQKSFLMGSVFYDDQAPDFLGRPNGSENIHLVLYNAHEDLVSVTSTGPMGSYRLMQQQGRNTWKAFSGEELLHEGTYIADQGSQWKDLLLPRK